MQHLTCNISGVARREFIGPHEYVVVPVTMIVPGVLVGNRGPILYTADENNRDPIAWNHIPLTDDHPTQNVSARSAAVLKDKWLGILLNAHTDGTGSLKGEAWFDIKATEKARPGYIRRIENGEKIELSTGLGLDAIDQPGTTQNGQDYGLVATNYRPDHLAILFDKPGACSIRDGCGVNNCESATPCDQCRQHQQQQNSDADSLEADGQETQAAEKTITINSGVLTMAEVTRESVIAGLIKNCAAWTEDDSDTLNAMSDEQLKRLADAETVHIRNAEAVEKLNAQNAADEKAKADEAAKKAADVATQNAATPATQTAEDWFKSAPDEVKTILNHARGLQEKHRTELVGKLVANARDDQKETLAAVYNGLAIEALETLAAAIPAKAEPVQNFFGAAPASNVQNTNKTAPIPVIPPLF
jgi:hypothetical protein